MNTKKILLIAGVLALGLGLAYGPRWGSGAGWGGQPGINVGIAANMHDAIAKFLGITTGELVTLHQGGKSISDIAKERGLDVAKLEAQLIPVRNNAIDQAVKDKTITPEQAALMKARTSEIVKATVQRKGGSAAGFNGNRGSGPGNGWHFNRGGRMGPRWNR